MTNHPKLITLIDATPDNILRFESSLSATASDNLYEISITKPTSDEDSWPCLVGASCKPCRGENCDPEAEELAREFHNSSDAMDTYPAEIEYKCPLGMEFQDPRAKGTTYPTQVVNKNFDN